MKNCLEFYVVCVPLLYSEKDYQVVSEPKPE